MILLRTVEGVRAHFPQRWTEWLMVIPALGIGIALHIQPYLFSTAPHYAAIQSWAHEETWELIILISALFRLAALVINGSIPWFRFTPHLRLAGAFVGGAIWSQFSLGSLLTYFEIGSSLGPVVSYGTLALIEFVNVFRASRAVGAWAREF